MLMITQASAISIRIHLLLRPSPQSVTFPHAPKVITSSLENGGADPELMSVSMVALMSHLKEHLPPPSPPARRILLPRTRQLPRMPQPPTDAALRTLARAMHRGVEATRQLVNQTPILDGCLKELPQSHASLVTVGAVATPTGAARS